MNWTNPMSLWVVYLRLDAPIGCELFSSRTNLSNHFLFGTMSNHVASFVVAITAIQLTIYIMVTWKFDSPICCYIYLLAMIICLLLIQWSFVYFYQHTLFSSTGEALCTHAWVLLLERVGSYGLPSCLIFDHYCFVY